MGVAPVFGFSRPPLLSISTHPSFLPSEHDNFPEESFFMGIFSPSTLFKSLRTKSMLQDETECMVRPSVTFLQLILPSLVGNRDDAQMSSGRKPNQPAEKLHSSLFLRTGQQVAGHSKTR